MALEIIDEKIVGTIDNLLDKIDGKLPIDKLELIELSGGGCSKCGYNKESFKCLVGVIHSDGIIKYSGLFNNI